MAGSDGGFRRALLEGVVIPAHPLALNAKRELDERRQRALTRYYVDAGAGGIAVGVHTTQFAIRQFDLYRPVLELAMETVNAERERVAQQAGEAARSTVPSVESAMTLGLGVSEPTLQPPYTGSAMVRIAGVMGDTNQAVTEASIARELGYDCVLLSLGGGAWTDSPDRAILQHCRAVGEVLPLFGFYLQPAVGGRILSHSFWRELAELPALVAIKVAPFNRYQTLDVVRAVVESGRDDVALYTGNDDSIVQDLLTTFTMEVGGRSVTRYFSGGLLGQWAVWTHSAVGMLHEIKRQRTHRHIERDLITAGAWLTDANGAIFDARNAFAGCIPGIHEVLRRQGLLAGTWCLDTSERLSPGQSEEIDRVLRSYPALQDDEFVRGSLDRWTK